MKTRFSSRTLFMRLLGGALVLMLSMTVFSQSPKEIQPKAEKTETGSPAQPSEYELRWHSTLQQLAQDALTLARAEDRPTAIAEVANAYWKLDRTRSSELFGEALDSALSQDLKSKDVREGIRRTLSLAAERDRSLYTKLSQRLVERLSEDKSANELLTSTAIQMLKDNRHAAIQLAEQAGASGLTMDVPVLIFKLAETDIPESKRLFTIYLNKQAKVLRLGDLLWLAGYALGYGEAWGGWDTVRMAGFSGFRIEGLVRDPALARAFLTAAVAATQKLLNQSAAMSPGARNQANSLALFATEYLHAEISRYLPDTEAQWQVLNTQALSGTPPERQRGVSALIKRIIDARSRVADYKTAEDYQRTNAETQLDEIERIADACKRDQAYAGVALSLSSVDFARGLRIAENIKDLGLRDSVVQFLQYDWVVAALRKNEIVEARNRAERITARQQRALLYAQIAESMLARGNSMDASDLLLSACQLAHSSLEPDEQPAVLLAAAATYAKFDRVAAYDALRSAVRAINRVDLRNVDSISIPRKVKLGCSMEKATESFGGSHKVERYSLIRSLALVASDNIGEAVAIAQEIKEPANRIRTLVAIIALGE